MRFVADLHLHSKYSRAVSRDMTLPVMAQFAKIKGIDILSTGDWTHPLWFREIQSQLEETQEGLFKLKTDSNSTSEESKGSPRGEAGHLRGVSQKELYFFLSVEVSSIYSQGGKTRRIHNLIFSPSFETAEKINKELVKKGCNLMSDGRPIIGISAKNLLELILTIDKRAVLIPCHCWTPWFSLFGSNSGFDSVEECFGEYSKYIFGIETGLSSDPLMNWQIKDLEKRTILSFSDAHSPAKMAREATVLDLVAPTYKNIIRAFIHPSVLLKTSPSILALKNGDGDAKRLENKIAYTIEFHPEEGKYHYNGHRNCKIVQSPKESREKGVLCPVCKRSLTIGVMHRVSDLSSDPNLTADTKLDEHGLLWFYDKTKNHPPFVKLVPLLEIVAESLSAAVGTIKVKTVYDTLCNQFGSDLQVLLKVSLEDIARVSNPKIAEGIGKVRKNDMAIDPGFDGEFGKVKIWPTGIEETKTSEQSVISNKKSKSQLGLF